MRVHAHAVRQYFADILPQGACARGDTCTFAERIRSDAGRHRRQGQEHWERETSVQDVRETHESTTPGQIVHSNSLGAGRSSSSLTTEALPPGLCTTSPRQPDTNSASSDNATALTASLQDILSPVRYLSTLSGRQHDSRHSPEQQATCFDAR